MTNNANNFLGLKLTHDGSVALVRNGKLDFCWEAEKVDGNRRYANIPDLELMFRVLRQEAVDIGDVDVLSIDGWRKQHRKQALFGEPIEFDINSYINHFPNTLDPFDPVNGKIKEYPFESYAHYINHVSVAYFLSPHAKAQPDRTVHVLVWDGAMMPAMYKVDPVKKSIEFECFLFLLLGDAYHEFAQHFWPFDGGLEWPATLSIPGKLMAYTALGKVSKPAVQQYEEIYESIFKEAIHTEFESRQRIKLLIQQAVQLPLIDQDALASWHEFLGKKLCRSVEEYFSSQAEQDAVLLLAGGCALNIKWNTELCKVPGVGTVWVPPVPNDAGNAIGACLTAKAARGDFSAVAWSVFSGPEIILPEEVPAGWKKQPCSVAELAMLLASGEIVVCLTGRAEIGPRALGHRSILASPFVKGMKDRLNLIKKRESYRPISPMCREEAVFKYFDGPTLSEYMLFEMDVRSEYGELLAEACHVDGTARVQSVNEQFEPKLFQLLTEFEKHTGYPILCNTSANDNGTGFFGKITDCMNWGRVGKIWDGDALYTRESEWQ
ncbi:carbamoyltransferase C-terminal domain-containing protein [Paludibacterium purpuratum]|uniref:Beta-1,4-N-acetylglucosamine oligosaccharide 6-O-carbamoyltransferase NodU n=1 Tax=Paludibacterium purpuratum TaxID=1144873 RepID=A0A4R7B8K4_9NEIS|nr:carbamoyltransferase C-terminal domain-containing protein [Paludibacterium purpuratum]TDR80066.1 beta-1,4-N-acetylglucosamine oligosaccharide 6-O-carbamoyltransferase NodU [Paludibacterium purpuratum]